MKINLLTVDYTREERLLAEAGEFKVYAFRYATGVAALRVCNQRGSFTILPQMGQQVWRCDFDGRELTMKSMFDEPKECVRCYDEAYGCFLMHCGLTAMGNPTPDDTHVGHGELPILRYDEACLEFGRDRGGEYVAVGGTARHKLCYTFSYAFSPRIVLHAGAARLEITASVTNRKDTPFEYYYLCHINHLPVEGSTIVESPLCRKPIINHEVPENYYPPWAEATNRWLAVLDKDYAAQAKIGAKGESYRPEIVNCYFHKPDRRGWAFVRQEYPKGGGVYVKYRPSELPYATRWIVRNPDEQALGMCLPATAEHKGRLYCEAHGQQRFLKPGETVTFHFETGLI